MKDMAKATEAATAVHAAVRELNGALAAARAIGVECELDATNLAVYGTGGKRMVDCEVRVLPTSITVDPRDVEA